MGDYEQLQAEVAELFAENQSLKAALSAIKAIALQAWGDWDSDRNHRVGLTIRALAGHLPGYRADIDAIHALVEGTWSVTHGFSRGLVERQAQH